VKVETPPSAEGGVRSDHGRGENANGGGREVAWYAGRVSRPTACYKKRMKIIERWLLFRYVGRELTLMAKPFKTKRAGEQARSKPPKKEQDIGRCGLVERVAG